MLFTSLAQGLREDFANTIGFMQIGAIGLGYLIAWILARKIRQYLDKGIQKAKTYMRIILSPIRFAVMLNYVFLLLLLWFSQVLFKAFTIPANLLHMALNMVIAVLVVRFASFYIKSTFWSRFVYVVCVVFIFLRIFKLWEPTVRMLDSMTIRLGKISISLWGLTEAIIVFIVLWAAAGVANRFIAQWLMTSTKLTYSDRTLLQRVIKVATLTVVILISLGAAGNHMWRSLLPGEPSVLASVLDCRKSDPI